MDTPDFSARFKYWEVIKIDMESSTEVLIREIYRKIEKIEREIDEIRLALIPEEEADENEKELIKKGREEIKEGKFVELDEFLKYMSVE